MQNCATKFDWYNNMMAKILQLTINRELEYSNELEVFSHGGESFSREPSHVQLRTAAINYQQPLVTKRS